MVLWIKQKMWNRVYKCTWLPSPFVMTSYKSNFTLIQGLDNWHLTPPFYPPSISLKPKGHYDPPPPSLFGDIDGVEVMCMCLREVVECWDDKDWWGERSVLRCILSPSHLLMCYSIARNFLEPSGTFQNIPHCIPPRDYSSVDEGLWGVESVGRVLGGLE